MTTKAPAAPTPAGDGYAAPEFLDFTVIPANSTLPLGSRQWISRGQNYILVYTQPVAGEILFDASTQFEQVVLLVQADSAVAVEGGGDDATATGETLVILPPGPSKIVASGTGAIVQLLQHDEPGWAERCLNADSYAQDHPRVAILEPWPEPVGGYRLRVYPMADVPADPKRFGRIFRSRAFMVNFFPAGNGPRDPAKMSPHFHDDFEQCSLTVAGTYIHHIQTPWGTDANNWRPEDHGLVNSPSVTVIPPPTVHTSQAMSWDVNHLIDIFSGPRHDFSAQSGWVLNADEYPMP